MIANDFGNFWICETRILSDYALLVVLAVKDESCGEIVRNEVKVRRVAIFGRAEDISQEACRKGVQVPFLGRGIFGSG